MDSPPHFCSEITMDSAMGFCPLAKHDHPLLAVMGKQRDLQLHPPDLEPQGHCENSSPYFCPAQTTGSLDLKLISDFLQ